MVMGFGLVIQEHQNPQPFFQRYQFLPSKSPPFISRARDSNTISFGSMLSFLGVLANQLQKLFSDEYSEISLPIFFMG
jgi:hypothetical protein